MIAIIIAYKSINGYKCTYGCLGFEMFNLSEAEMASVERIGGVLKGLDMPMEQAQAFLAIARRQGLSVQELADELGVPQSSASRYVKALVGYEYKEGKFGPINWKVGHQGYGLVEQRINEQEPRKRSLVLTEAGVALVKGLQDVLDGARNGVPQVGTAPITHVIRIWGSGSDDPDKDNPPGSPTDWSRR